MVSLGRSLGITLTALLSACGGGGDSSPVSESVAACGDSITFTPMWTTNGVNSQRIDGKVGVPMVATPSLLNLAPPSCVGRQTYTLTVGTVLPRGLSLDPVTGTISGTPLEAKELFGEFIVRVQFPGVVGGIGILSVLDIDP